jgi:uncharacterized protein
MAACKKEMSMAERQPPRLLAWKGPDPLRVDAAQVALAPDRLTARGTSAVEDYVLDWVLETGPAWVTRTLSVRARGDGYRRSLELGRGDDGTWSALRRQDGQPADSLEVAGLEGALDCDLGLCPFTNTMPVLRHDLVAGARRGEAHPVELVMAWVAVPELTVHRSDQRYEPIDEHRVRYVGLGSDFVAELELDDDGLVVRYPELGERV